jgi:hypothetical protein
MKRLTFILIAGLLVSSCSTLKVTTDYDKNSDFSKFKTYSYLGWSADSETVLNKLDKDRIEKAFAEEFAKRGIEYVKKGGDIEVSLFIVVDQKTSTTAYTDYYGGYGGYGYARPWGWGTGYATTRYHDYDYLFGTLVCDVFDGTSKDLIWQGVGAGTVNEDPKKRERGIPIAVRKIMYEYPVKPVKNK